MPAMCPWQQAVDHLNTDIESLERLIAGDFGGALDTPEEDTPDGIGVIRR